MTTRFFSKPHFTLFTAVLGFSVVCDRVAGEDFGNALAFDGVSQYVSVPNFGALVPLTEVTVEFWAFADAEAYQSVFTLFPDVPANRFSSHINYGNGNSYWDFGDIDNGGRVSMPNPPNTLGVWTHYAFVASQTQGLMKIYVNGESVASSAAMNPFEANNLELRIGGNPGINFHGKVDEFRVWNKPRTVAEIRAGRFAPLAGNEIGLRLYYRFDEGGGAVALNSATATGPAWNGILVNGPAWTAPSPRLGIDLDGLGSAQSFSSARTVGWSFILPSAVKVTSLGMLDYTFNGAGFVNPHALGLWKNDGTLLASTTMPAGTNSTQVPLRNHPASWRFVSIPPVTLAPGNYRIGAFFRADDDDDIAVGPPLIPTPGCTFQISWMTDSSGLVFPTGGFPGVFAGPNFQFTGIGTAASWDANSTTAPNPLNGGGSWDTVSPLWWNGVGHAAWEQGGAATFGAGSGVPGEVSVDMPVTLRALTFEAAAGGAYTIKGPQSITLGTASTALVANTDATISAVLAGTNAGLVKSGAGTLALTAANTYTGATTISGGMLVLSNPPPPGGIFLGDASTGSAGVSLQASAAVNNPITVAASGTGVTSLGSTGSGTAVYTGPLTLLREITLTGTNPDPYPPSSHTAKTQFNGPITGPSGVKIAGPGWVQLEAPAANTYTGPTTVLSGAKLSVWKSNALPPTPLIIQTGGFARLEGASLTCPGLSGGGHLQGNLSYGYSTVTLGSGNADYEFTGEISLAVNLVKTGTGTQKLLGSNSLRGNTTIQQGTLVKRWSDLADTGSLIIAAGAKLHLLQDAEDVVSALIVDGVSKPAGLYGALSSANPNDTEIPFITGVGRIRIVPVPVAFAQWALSHGLTGANAAYAADPDQDGSLNLEEFALGGNPVLSGNVPAAYASVADLNGQGYKSLTYTFLVRNGAVVSYDGNDALLKADGITYHIQGSRDLIGFNVRVDITPVRPGPVATPAGYQYITFFISATDTARQGYMRAWISVP